MSIITPLIHCDMFTKENVGTFDEQQELISLIDKLEQMDLGLEPLPREIFASSYSTQNALSEDNFKRFDFTGSSYQHKNFNNYSIYDFKWLVDTIMELFKEVSDHYLSLDKSFKRFFEGDPSISQTWLNIRYPNSVTYLHSHKSNVLSFIYYIKCPENSGNLIFRNPVNLCAESNHQSPFVNHFSYSPKDGDLLMFPSWIPHEVDRNNTSMNSTNIAGDITLL